MLAKGNYKHIQYQKISYYKYYKKLRDADKKFPFLNYTACAINCKRSVNLNKKYDLD